MVVKLSYLAWDSFESSIMSLGEVMRNSLLSQLHNGIHDDGTASLWSYIHAENRSFWDIFGMIAAIKQAVEVVNATIWPL